MNGKNPSKSTSSKRKGTGIENAKRKLELLYPGNYEMQVIEVDDVFIVNLKMKLVNNDAVANHDKTEEKNQGFDDTSLARQCLQSTPDESGG